MTYRERLGMIDDLLETVEMWPTDKLIEYAREGLRAELRELSDDDIECRFHDEMNDIDKLKETQWYE